MFKRCFSVLSIFLSFNIYAGSNRVNIDISTLNYERPESNRGSAGEFEFSQVRMTWDGMVVSLDNNASFLEANIKVNPRYINFKTAGMGVTFPMNTESGFYSVASLGLSKSKFRLNSGYLNFSGDKLSVSDGISKLILDEFNLYCNAPQSVDMTKPEGLIQGCLTEMILNGKDEDDLAGATIEYFDQSDSENGIYLSSRLKDFTLEENLFKLDLNQASLRVGGFNIALGESVLSCQKKEGVIDFNLEELKNSCLNDLKVAAPKIEATDIKGEIKYKLSLKELETRMNSIYANIPVLIASSPKKSTHIKKIELNCFRADDSEFYDLRSVVAGCSKDAQITIDAVELESHVKKGLFQKIFSSKGETTEYVPEANISIHENLLKLDAVIDIPKLPKFKLSFEAHVIHDAQNGTVALDIIRFKAMKIIRVRAFLLMLLDFFVGDEENINVDNQKITYKYQEIKKE